MKNTSFLKKLWPGTWLNSFLKFDKPEIFLPDDQKSRKRYVWLVNYPVTLGFILMTGMKTVGFFSNTVHSALNNPDSFLTMIYDINYIITVFCFIWALKNGNDCVQAKAQFDRANQANAINSNSSNNNNSQQITEAQNDVKNQTEDNTKALYFSDFQDVKHILEREFGGNKNIAQNLEKETK